ncbi:BRO family protein [Pseudomonas sp. LFM046]|uniref:BRO-N domain-containing protein n=1 Tax=Pseudomonas sp. LFM046 TaxID=1608357 RepID=UPI001F5B0596|nr:BRO family protein [Pseudomonas sp. LFM046]
MPDFPQFHPAPSPDAEVLMPATFIRHKLQLRAVLLDEEPWFSSSDLARLINHPLVPERVQRNLDDDQVQRAWMRNSHGDFEQELLISESGVYAVLIFYYHPENRGLRHWINREVIPRLRQEERFDEKGPYREVIQWLDRELEVLHWQGKAWLHLGDCPNLLQRPPQVIG